MAALPNQLMWSAAKASCLSKVEELREKRSIRTKTKRNPTRNTILGVHYHFLISQLISKKWCKARFMLLDATVSYQWHSKRWPWDIEGPHMHIKVIKTDSKQKGGAYSQFSGAEGLLGKCHVLELGPAVFITRTRPGKGVKQGHNVLHQWFQALEIFHLQRSNCEQKIKGLIGGTGTKQTARGHFFPSFPMQQLGKTQWN